VGKQLVDGGSGIGIEERIIIVKEGLLDRRRRSVVGRRAVGRWIHWMRWEKLRRERLIISKIGLVE